MGLVGDRIISYNNTISNCLIENAWGTFGWLCQINSNNEDMSGVPNNMSINGGYIQGTVENNTIISSGGRHQGLGC